MIRLRNVALAVTLCGIGLFEAVGYASDFGLIHFYGSVLYSGCYILGTQNHASMITAFDSDDKSVNFNMRFKHCRLVDHGQVLAEVSIAHHDWDSLRMLQTNGRSVSINSYQSKEMISRFSLKGFLTEITQVGTAALQFRHKNSQVLVTDRDVELEIIYR